MFDGSCFSCFTMQCNLSDYRNLSVQSIFSGDMHVCRDSELEKVFTGTAGICCGQPVLHKWSQKPSYIISAYYKVLRYEKAEHKVTCQPINIRLSAPVSHCSPSPGRSEADSPSGPTPPSAPHRNGIVSRDSVPVRQYVLSGRKHMH